MTDELEVDWALNRSRELVAQGADIIDVGAESARTKPLRDTRGGGVEPPSSISRAVSRFL